MGCRENFYVEKPIVKPGTQVAVFSNVQRIPTGEEENSPKIDSRNSQKAEVVTKRMRGNDQG
jgi:hypothetical protein